MLDTHGTIKLPPAPAPACPRCSGLRFWGSDQYGAYLHCGWCGVYQDIGPPRTGQELASMWEPAYTAGGRYWRTHGKAPMTAPIG